ncbi:hypothetical protein SI65_01437 [Aspergillus cristatus]|uniref:tRNA-splicing endonuclease subunit Sen15 domain-containing protein n=1 Tax=Aspergillus cristatus TaxID=573508 RepID=A0A1E3BSJ4_ASPCR|nr:hypothetical protein SI65_01437 [Aspergillus cristatus]
MTSKIPPPSSNALKKSPEPSALTTLISSAAISPTTSLSAATLQVLHNLQHQHLWTSLQIHRLSLPEAPSTSSDVSYASSTATTAFVISGVPPNRIYTHPDEQLFMLERGLRDNDIDPERTFVLPTVEGQSWSLRKMAAVFDSLPQVDEGLASLAPEGGREGEESQPRDEKEAKIAEYLEYRKSARATKDWGGKRLLLSMVDRNMGGDGTVVYYVVQEGTVKPRQN